MELRIIDIDGPLHYADYGGEGPPMILVHGLGGSHLNWMHVADDLARTHRVYAVDLAGFGLTPPAGRRATVQANQGLLHAFTFAMAAEQAVLVGNSMGGLVALMEAAAHPGLYSALVLVNSALPLADTRAINGFTLQRLVVPLIPGVGELAMRHFYQSISPEEQLELTLAATTAEPHNLSPAGREASLEMIRLRRQMEWAIPSFLQASRSIAAQLARRRRFRAMLAEVECPVLLMHGREDRIVSSASATWAAHQRPDWRLEMLDGVGHVPQIETPELFVRLVTDFLEGG